MAARAKSVLSCGPADGRDFLTPGHPGVGVRNVRGKFGPKSLCLSCFSYLNSRIFCPKDRLFILPFPYVPSAFSGVLSIREFRTQFQDEQEEPERELAVVFFDFVARIRARIFTKNSGADFAWGCPKNIHIKSTAPRIPKSERNNFIQ